jgi:hypothetical protein
VAGVTASSSSAGTSVLSANAALSGIISTCSATANKIDYKAATASLSGISSTALASGTSLFTGQSALVGILPTQVSTGHSAKNCFSQLTGVVPTLSCSGHSGKISEPVQIQGISSTLVATATALQDHSGISQLVGVSCSAKMGLGHQGEIIFPEEDVIINSGSLVITITTNSGSSSTGVMTGNNDSAVLNIGQLPVTIKVRRT